MNLLIRVYDNSKKIFLDKSIKITKNFVTINDDFINPFIGEEVKEDISLLEIFIKGRGISMVINSYSLTKSLHIYKFDEEEVSFNLLKVSNVDIKLSHLNVKKLILDTEKGRVEKCYINDFSYLENIKNPYKNNLYVIDSEVTNFNFYNKVNYLYFKNTLVNKIKNFSKNNRCAYYCYFVNCNIGYIFLGFYSKNFTLLYSNVVRMDFLEGGKINTFRQEKSFIEKVYNCDYEKIVTKNINGYELIEKSSKKTNGRLYLKVKYDMTNMRNRIRIEKEKNIIKKYSMLLTNYFLKYSIGYGYKPFNAILFSISSIVFFGFIYFIIDAISFPLNNYNLIDSLVNSIYLSGSAFTTIGFGDVAPRTNIGKMLCILQGGLGISTSAFFVMSLTKKYIE